MQRSCRYGEKCNENNCPYDHPVKNFSFQWSWQRNSGCFQPYDNQMNLMIEKEYKFHNIKFITPSIGRISDGLPQTYTIDFEKNLQTNNITKYSRKIKREDVNISKVLTLWQFEDEKNVWKPFDRSSQIQIEAAYKKYCLSNSESALRGLRITGRPATYTIDFENNIQMNESSKRKRKIRKLEK